MHFRRATEMKEMIQAEEQVKKLAALTSVLVMAAAEAMAQEKPGMVARRIVVSIPDRKLALIENGAVVKVYQTAVGAPRTPSPTGNYKVNQRIADPTWYYKGRIVPPGKTNPLGTRWMGLSCKGYGIHGTSNPSSIGKNASHGCIRMRNREVEDLFARIEVGDAVEIYGEHTPELDRIFGNMATPVQVAGATAPAAAGFGGGSQ